MKKTIKRVVVASLLILLASLYACGREGARDARPVAAPVPEPTLIAIRDAAAPSSADKTPKPYAAKKKTKKGEAGKKNTASKAAPAGTRPPDCPKCPDQGADTGAGTGAGANAAAGTAASASNPVLDALAKELSLALDTNKAADQEPAAKAAPAATTAQTPEPKKE
ncbi:MAG: hypothetical protein HQK81_02515 [Desulfovibrionaceae bacterium]|nr:hypothetical protein [Desulfovibrionaceae bacterium]MBF0512918.1 hypothetical protein [Desulfovibrionaceae bacterium]